MAFLLLWGLLFITNRFNYLISYIPAMMVSQWHSDLAHGGMKKVCCEKGKEKKSQEVISKAQRHRVFRNAEWGNS
jgi:hypothetical protein